MHWPLGCLLYGKKLSKPNLEFQLNKFIIWVEVQKRGTTKRHSCVELIFKFFMSLVEFQKWGSRHMHSKIEQEEFQERGSRPRHSCVEGTKAPTPPYPGGIFSPFWHSCFHINLGKLFGKATTKL